jgi:hypothetical protein
VTEPRRFPPHWSAEEPDPKLDRQCYIIRDANGQALACVYFEKEPDRRSAAHLLTRDDARRNMESSHESSVPLTSRTFSGNAAIFKTPVCRPWPRVSQLVLFLEPVALECCLGTRPIQAEKSFLTGMPFGQRRRQPAQSPTSARRQVYRRAAGLHRWFGTRP